MDEAIEVVSKTCAYTNHTILAEALEKWPLSYLEKVVPQLDADHQANCPPVYAAKVTAIRRY